MVTGWFVDHSPYGFNGAFGVCVAFAVIGGILYIWNDYERLLPKAKDA